MPYFKFRKTFLGIFIVRVSFVAIVSAIATLANPAHAQIIPDATLQNNSRVTTQNNLRLIEGGTQAGGNLFHSFQQFSVPAGSTAYFNNASDIHNIITRVTGGLISNINGLIQANGTANVFVINPSGIVFGQGATLNLGGSFLASTANSLKFADGTQFSAIVPQQTPTPLLTISIPIGLQFSENSGRILVQGKGQGLRATSELVDTTVGLHVQPNKTLALVGGDVALVGGTLKTPGGRIELGSVAGTGFVKLISINKGWALDYEGIQNFGDINLSQQTAVDASGLGSGDIQIRGKRLMLSDGSQIENSTLGKEAGGMLMVNGSESVELSGTSATGGATGFGTQIYPGASGAGGNLTIETGRLIIRDGAQISSSTNGAGSAGSLVIQARDSVTVSGAGADGLVLSGIFTATFPETRGTGGNLTIETGQLIVRDGGQISSGTNGAGSAGSLVIQARDSVTVSGVSVVKKTGKKYPSTIGTSTEPGSTGSSNDLILNTQRLVVQKGAVISTATFGEGMSGTLSIRADSVELSDPSLSDTLSVSGLSARSGGKQKSGDIIIDARQLSVHDGTQISVKNSGTGNAGLIQIHSNSIKLNNQGSITASTAAGEGGNIFLYSDDLQLRRGSAITATAGNRGNGGNITIDANTLAALEISNITANAFEGRGGNVKINTQGLFLSPNSQITASSHSGVNGTVQINAPEVDLTRAAVYFPSAVNPPKIAIICAGRKGGAATGELVNAGRGGIPISPDEPLNSSAGWYDNSTPAQETEESEKIVPEAQIKPVQKFVEAQGWKSNGDGTVSFTNVPDEVVPYGSLSEPPCHARALSTKN